MKPRGDSEGTARIDVLKKKKIQIANKHMEKKAQISLTIKEM